MAVVISGDLFGGGSNTDVFSAENNGVVSNRSPSGGV